MKRARSFSVFLSAAALFVLSFLEGTSLAATLPKVTTPTITRFRAVGTNLHITASIPAGFRSVTLESHGTNDLGAWKPRDLRRLNGKAARIVFRVTQSAAPQNFRLTASASDKLPAKFYRGKKSYPRVRSKASRVQGVFGAETARSGLGDMSALASPGSGLPPVRAVVESDIWKISGNRLYYFNQYRGLQILDISSPDSASLLNTVSLPAAGEQMYVLGNHVVLLARNDCDRTGNGNSELVIINVAASSPVIVARVPVSGSIAESRLVGSALYVASQEGNFSFLSGATVVGDGGTNDSGTLISSFDLANPAAPIARGTLRVNGYGNVISATDNFLFVAVQGADATSQVNIIDISSPNGTMLAGGSAAVAGHVADKFKIHFASGVLTVISEVIGGREENTPGTLRPVGTLVNPATPGTILETFSLANISAPAKLGDLQLAPGERLFATRFDSNRVYIVTFEQTDPLWIVDLSDPANPEIKGHVEVPGYSTFIEPVGNRLVTIGQDSSNGWRVAVSLFDVSNVSQPRLLSKVSLGENYSWSEAMWDEKAFNVLPAAGLILLPYEGDFSNGYASRVQLIDWRNDSLQLRGSIDHKLQPRRATLAQNRVISVSGWEFLAVNVDDRDHPVVTRDLTLAWPVDRVILSGDYLLEFGVRGFFSGDERAIIRIGRAESPNQILTQWSLGDVPILGATVKSNLLYLLQSESSRFAFDATGNPLPQTNSATLSVIDLTMLPNLEIVGQTQATLSNSLSAWNLTPLWVRDDLLVWESANSYWFFPILFAAQPSAHIGFASAATEVYATPATVASPTTGPTPTGSLAPGGIVANRFLPPWFYGGGAGTELVAFNVSDSANPQFISEMNLRSDEWSTHNAAFAGNGLVYLSHTKFDSGSRLDDDIWMEKYYLDVIDYSDAANPTLRDAVNISGALAGVSHEGNMLYTVSSHTARSEKTWIDALAYDGVRASLIGSLALPSEWPHPTLIADTNIFVGVPKSDSTGAIEVWNVSVSGRLVRASSAPLAQPAHSFAAFGQLFVAQTENRLQLFDATNPLALQPLVNGAAENCLWPNLEHADGSVDRGLWAPLGDYGVLKISR